MSCDYHFEPTDVKTRLQKIIERDKQASREAQGGPIGHGPNSWHGPIEKIRSLSLRDDINHPPHYTEHPSGIECIQITEHFNFCLGNAIKYLWRSGKKDSEINDLKKAAWYINREIDRIKKMEDK